MEVEEAGEIYGNRIGHWHEKGKDLEEIYGEI